MEPHSLYCIYAYAIATIWRLNGAANPAHTYTHLLSLSPALILNPNTHPLGCAGVWCVCTCMCVCMFLYVCVWVCVCGGGGVVWVWVSVLVTEMEQERESEERERVRVYVCVPTLLPTPHAPTEQTLLSG